MRDWWERAGVLPGVPLDHSETTEAADLPAARVPTSVSYHVLSAAITIPGGHSSSPQNGDDKVRALTAQWVAPAAREG